MWPRSSDMIKHHTLNYIWLDRAGSLVKSKLKVRVTTCEGEAGFASD